MGRKPLGVTKRVRPNFKQKPPRNFVREWRQHRTYTQDDLADRLETMFGLKITTASLSRMETMKQPMETGLLDLIGKVLNTSPLALMSRGPKDAPGLDEIWARIPQENRKQAMRVLTALAGDGATEPAPEVKRKRA